MISFSGLKAQEKELQPEKESHLVPLSIYQSNFLKMNSFSAFNLNNELLKTKMRFTFLVKDKMVDEHYFVPLTFRNGRPTKYIYESYNALYHRKDLQKSFFKLADLYDLPRQKNPK